MKFELIGISFVLCSCIASHRAVAPVTDLIGRYEAVDNRFWSHDILQIKKDSRFISYSYGEWRRDTIEGTWSVVNDTLILNSLQQSRIVDAFESWIDSIAGFSITLLDTTGNQVFDLDSVYILMDTTWFGMNLPLHFDSLKKEFEQSRLVFNYAKPKNIEVKMAGAIFSYAVKDSSTNSVIFKLFHPNDFDYELVFRDKKYLRRCNMLFELFSDGSLNKNYPYFKTD